MLTRILLRKKILAFNLSHNESQLHLFSNSNGNLKLLPNRYLFGTSCMRMSRVDSVQNDDFFGVLEERSERSVQDVNSSETVSKYSPLPLKVENSDYERQIQMPFGLVRLDTISNSPSLTSGLSSKDISRLIRGEKVALLSTETSDINDPKTDLTNESCPELAKQNILNRQLKNRDLNFFDEQYFDSNLALTNTLPHVKNTESSSIKKLNEHDAHFVQPKLDGNFFDNQYFNSHITSDDSLSTTKLSEGISVATVSNNVVVKNDTQKSKTNESNTLLDQPKLDRNFFDEQYFDNYVALDNSLPTAEYSEGNSKAATSTKAEAQVDSNYFDSCYFGELSHHHSQKVNIDDYSNFNLHSAATKETGIEDASSNVLYINELEKSELKAKCQSVDCKLNKRATISDKVSIPNEMECDKNLIPQKQHKSHSSNANNAEKTKSEHMVKSSYNTAKTNVDNADENYAELPVFASRYAEQNSSSSKQGKKVTFNDEKEPLDKQKYEHKSKETNQFNSSTQSLTENFNNKKNKTFEKGDKVEQKSKTAYDAAMNIRLEKRGIKLTSESEAPKRNEEVVDPNSVKWEGKVDSKGFRILTAQVVDLQRVPEMTVLQILKKNIIFENDHLIAINKPYGLPTHGGPGVHNSVGKFATQLYSSINKSAKININNTDDMNLSEKKDEKNDSCSRNTENQLYLVHRLDKETTGVMVMAKTKQIAFKLRELFKKREVVKKYWVITKGVPQPAEGIIDIPITEGTVEDKFRMTLRPNYSPEMRLMFNATSDNHGSEAITKYRVIDSRNSTALVELEPSTGVKHQIRCHLAFALNTPILGDHKYSHYSKLAPQRLHPEILQHLGIRQAKVRHLPMHLHAYSLILPEFMGAHNIFIKAPLPKHFLQNMKWLQLNSR